MKPIIFYSFLFLSVLATYSNDHQNKIFPEGYFKFYQLNNKSKKDLILELGNLYKNSFMQDTIYRSKIVNFLIDTIVANDEVNSALASKVLLQYTRLNEINIEQKEKLLNVYLNGWFNVDLTQLVGLLDDDMYVETLNNIYINNMNLKKHEREVLLSTMARLGHKESIKKKLNYFKTEFNQNSMTLNQEYADQLNNIHYINRKEIYDLLFKFVENDMNKTIVIGTYGGDPYGGDDNIYCTLSSFSLEILSQIIIDFPLDRVICSNDSEKSHIKVIQSWYKNNKNYKFKKWHPYYGTYYDYWPSNVN